MLGIGETRDVWTGYAHPVVFFVFGCLMVALVAESVGLTERLGRFILRYTGTNVARFSFIACIGFGVASSVMHDIAACAAPLVWSETSRGAVGAEHWSER
ncbi:MAG: SLC13 family permease [Bacillota bacterium]